MKPNKHLKVIIDTNLWISFIISKNFSQLESLLYSNKVRLLFSVVLIEEINQTIRKPKLSRYFRKGGLEAMLRAFDPFIDLIHVSSRVDICRDPNDNFLLELAEDGNADYLLTGDQDLLSIRKYGNTEIIKISEFFEKHYEK